MAEPPGRPKRGRRRGQAPGPEGRVPDAAAESGPAGPARPRTLGEAVGALFRGVVGEGWAHLLEVVMLSVFWSACMFLTVIGVVAATTLSTTLQKDGILLSLLLLAFPLAFAGPGSVGLFHAMDTVWSGEANGALDAMRNFFIGFRRRFLRSVGLSALWALVGLATYSNLVEDRRLVPLIFILGIDVILLYLVLFSVMVNTYLIGILATTDFPLLRAVRVAAWQAVANPVFTLIAIFAPGVVVLLALSVRALAPLIVGGALGIFGVGALRLAPLRHPDLPVPVSWRVPLEDPPEQR